MNDLYLLAENFLALFMESAPWLLLGLLVAAIMHELVPVSLLQRHMGSDSVGAVTKAAVIGAPLPLCSCGVIPAAVGLRRSGASKPATVSFLVSTPETGVDSVSVSYALLGPLYAIVRPFAAIFSAIYAGLMVKFFAPADAPSKPVAASTNASSCCSSATPEPAEATGCCGTKDAQASSCGSKHPTLRQTPARDKAKAMWAFGTGQLLSDITLWLLFGLTLAAAIQTWVPTNFLTQWGDGVIAMLVMALIGIPMYICATASTPLAVGFLAAGLSPGAVLVFLLAGPATNVSTMGMMLKELGRRALMLYLFSVLTASIALGYMLNWAVSAFSLQPLIVTAGAMHEHGEHTQIIYTISALVLALLMIRNLAIQAIEHFQTSSSQSDCCH